MNGSFHNLGISKLYLSYLVRPTSKYRFERSSPIVTFSTGREAETEIKATNKYMGSKNPKIISNSSIFSSDPIDIPFTETPSTTSESISSTGDISTFTEGGKKDSNLNGNIDLNSENAQTPLRKANVEKDSVFIVNAEESGVQIITGDGKTQREDKEKLEEMVNSKNLLHGENLNGKELQNYLRKAQKTNIREENNLTASFSNFIAHNNNNKEYTGLASESKDF